MDIALEMLPVSGLYGEMDMALETLKLSGLNEKMEMDLRRRQYLDTIKRLIYLLRCCQ
jgi:hypothetical protein